jgi:PAS domain S-box-containing protein
MADTGSEAQFRRVIEAAPDGIVVSRNGVVLFANPSAVALLGYDDAAALVGQPMTLFLDAAEIAVMRERIMATARGGPPLVPQEYTARRRDGSQVIAEITSLPIEWDGGPAVIALVRDVTERARMQGQLTRTDRLRALGTLAAGVAHEVNNPLAYMALALEALDGLIQSGMAPEQRADALKVLAEIRGGAKRVSTIVRDLRAFAQDGERDEGPGAGADVAEVLATMQRLVKHDVSHRATLTVDAPALPPVAGSTRRLEQVVVNLVLNAAQAVEGHGPSPQILVRAFLSGEGSVSIEVTDNGPGLGKDVLPRIFDPFTTAKAAQLGSGLGLATSHRIVTELGGSLTVESELGLKTTFRVTLPIIPLDTRGLARAVETAPVDTGQRWRVLVVDDEPTIRRLLCNLLGHHDVEAVGSGEEALARLRADDFDVVVCDLMMPTVTGMDVFVAIAAERPGLERRFVFITGGAFTERGRAFLERIPNRRLEKPFTIRDLEAAMAQTVAETGPKRM